jgi:hypothetical protein
VWKHRFSTHLEPWGLRLEHARTPKEVRDWVISRRDTDNCVFLVDYEFNGSAIDGLDLISEHALQPRAICVSSHFDDPRFQVKARQLGIRALPKSLAGEIEIRLI